MKLRQQSAISNQQSARRGSPRLQERTVRGRFYARYVSGGKAKPTTEALRHGEVKIGDKKEGPIPLRLKSGKKPTADLR
jgi:hypothetical protein